MSVQAVSTFDGARAVRQCLREAALWSEENGHFLPPEEPEGIVQEMARAFKDVAPKDLPEKLALFFGTEHAMVAAALPAIVVRDMGQDPVYDDDVDDSDADAWAIRKTKERERRERIQQEYRGWFLVMPPQQWSHPGLSKFIGPARWWWQEHRGEWTKDRGKKFAGPPQAFIGEVSVDWYLGSAKARSVIPQYHPFPKPARRTLAWTIKGHKCNVYQLDCHVCSYYMALTLRPIPAPMTWSWRHPVPQEVQRWVDVFGGHPPTALTLYLQRLLFMNDGIRTDPYNESKTAIHYYDRLDMKDYPLTVGRRLLLRSSRGDYFLKPWECIDHRMRKVTYGIRRDATTYDEARLEMEETVDRELDEAVDVGLEPAMNSHERMQMSVKPDYTIVKSARKKSKKIPGYKTHDSAADVMAYLGCSRATAFRKIKAGFRIPEREHAIQSRT